MWNRVRNKLFESSTITDSDHFGRLTVDFDHQLTDGHYDHANKKISIGTKYDSGDKRIGAAYHELIHREQFYRCESINHEAELADYIKNLPSNPFDEKYKSNPLEWMAYAGGDVEALFRNGESKQALVHLAAPQSSDCSKRFERLDSLINNGFGFCYLNPTLKEFSGYWKYVGEYANALPD